MRSANAPLIRLNERRIKLNEALFCQIQGFIRLNERFFKLNAQRIKLNGGPFS